MYGRDTVCRSSSNNVHCKSGANSVRDRLIFSSLCSHSFQQLKAEKLAPQIGAVLLLAVFYMTNYQLVGYIPKNAFSSLLVLSSIDMISNWGIKSYSKTKEKIEWAVVPLIVVLAFLVGLLQAVFMGIGLSTFLFVAAFCKSECNY
jgi:uncharacterized membrane protein YfcA